MGLHDTPMDVFLYPEGLFVNLNLDLIPARDLRSLEEFDNRGRH